MVRISILHENKKKNVERTKSEKAANNYNNYQSFEFTQHAIEQSTIFVHNEEFSTFTFNVDV